MILLWGGGSRELEEDDWLPTTMAVEEEVEEEVVEVGSIVAD